MPLSTRESIIALAENHIQQNGYNAFSYYDIAIQLGIKNAAVHYYFPKKEDLLKAVLDKSEQHFQNMVELSKHNDINYMDKLNRFLEIYDYNLNRQNRVCLMGALATDLFTLPAHLRPALNQLVEAMKNWLTQILEEARNAGEFKFDGVASDRAALICSSMAGALQLARVLGNKEYEVIKSQLIKDLIK
ncbi:MAG: TetR/AcrR family transcriptional regulator [Bacteroidota bacterium]